METIYFQPPGIRPQYCEVGMISDTDPGYIWYLNEPCKILISEVKIIPKENVIYDEKSRSYLVMDKKDYKVMNEELNLPLQQPNVDSNVYLIKLGHYIDSGYLEEMGTNKKAIEKIVIEAAKRNDLPGVKEIIKVELVDLFHLTVHYKYKNYSNEIETGQLFLSKFLLIS